MEAPSAFISYSHDSPQHVDHVLAFADQLIRDGIDVILDQYESSPPEGWPRWMDKHIRQADFVLMVCTDTYCRRVMGEEESGTGLGVRWEGNLIYQHIYNANTTNPRFIPLLFEYCKVEHIPTPLQGVTFYQIDTPDGYEKLYRRITNQPRIKRQEMGKLRVLPPRERKPDYLGVKVTTAKLPSSSPNLFGREKELAAINAAWDNRHINLISLVAWGGVGKTALVNKWLLQIARDNYRGAERVFGWSFYSQGEAGGRQVSADEFITAALVWFGDADPTKGSPWDKGERLAELVKQQRTLLILDGLEPLQNPPPVEVGRVKDPGLSTLLRELARHNPGLVVITTRLPVDDLKDFVSSSAIESDLGNLSSDAGATYLAHLGVKGTTEELKRAVAEFGGHALTLTLLGRYLVDVFDGDIRKRDAIPKLTDEEEKGTHAKRVMKAYEKWFMEKPEQDILYMLGLFDRPAEKGAIEVLRVDPPIEGLTNHLKKLSHEKWQLALKHLRSARLLSAPDPNEPDTLDCHPLLREHFRDRVCVGNPKAWREAHSRLYEYYQSLAKELPDTVEEMAPVFMAVAHGCQAGRHREALKVYYKRIQRSGAINYCCTQLGAISADLATLSGFFDVPWYKPLDVLTEDIKAVVLNWAGFRLEQLGRLPEAAQSMQAALKSHLEQKNWFEASRDAINLRDIYQTSGELLLALDYARQAVKLSDLSGDGYMRRSNRALLANSLYNAGHATQAEAYFREAETMQRADFPQHPFLVSNEGITFCELLLDQGEFHEVGSRAVEALKWAENTKNVVDIGMAYLCLGQTHLIKAHREGIGDFTHAATNIEHAVGSLRQSRSQEFIVRGLLAREELWRISGALEKVRPDLDEAFTIATRCGMRLLEADCHLEYALLYLACGEKDKAREHLTKAKKMIEEMGYHRRDKELKELRIKLDADYEWHNNTFKPDPASGAA